MAYSRHGENNDARYAWREYSCDEPCALAMGSERFRGAGLRQRGGLAIGGEPVRWYRRDRQA